MMPVGGVDGSMEATSHHIYPASAMVGDYLRAAAGLLPAGAVMVTTPLGAVGATVVGGFAALFALFGLRTVFRHATRLEMTDTALRAHGASSCTIRWAELDRLKLAYYSTRRDRKSGWMQLELGAGRARVRLDSRIDGFDRLVRRAAEEADQRGLTLNEATLANLQAMGVRLPAPGVAP